MNIDQYLQTIEAWPLSAWIRDSLYAFPFIESIHVVALTLVFGTIAIVDLRLLGLASVRRPFSQVASDIEKWTWVAFVAAVVTGVLMFITNAPVYYINPQFRAKMFCLALSGLNVFIFQRTTARTVSLWDKDESAPLRGKIAGGVSIVLWITIIVLGRWVGFTATANLEADPTAPEINLDDLFN